MRSDPLLPRLLGGVAVLALAAGSDASIYSTSARVLGSGFGEIAGFPGTGTAWAAGGISLSQVDRSAEAIGRTQEGFVAGYAQAAITLNSGPASGNASSRAGGSFSLADFVVTRLPGFEHLPTLVETTVQVAFDPTSDFGKLSNLNGGLGSDSGFTDASPSALAPIIASTAMMTVDSPRTLSLSIQISARVESVAGVDSGRFAASFAGSEAVLLPEGYVANSSDGAIVDNVYLGSPRPITVGVAGDYNFDGLVDAADYTAWRDSSAAGIALPNDTTPESVSTADYDVWRNNYGGAPAMAVPEPTPAVLCAAMLISGWRGRRRRPPTFGTPS